MGFPVAAAMQGGVSLSGNIFNALGQQSAQQFARENTERAHQREVLDLKKAGLNPILSATGGSGASAPTLSPARADIPDLTSAYQADTQRKQASQQNELIAAQTNKTNQEGRVAKVTADNAEYNNLFMRAFPELELALKQNEVYKSDAMTSNKVLRSMVEQALSEASSAKSKSQLLNLQIPEAKKSAEFWRGKMGTVAPYLNMGGHSSALEAFKTLSLLFAK